VVIIGNVGHGTIADHSINRNEQKSEGRTMLWKQLESNAQRKSATPDIALISVTDTDINMSLGGESSQAVPSNGNTKNVDGMQYREENGDRLQQDMVRKLA
jgi:hypothetical protein